MGGQLIPGPGDVVVRQDVCRGQAVYVLQRSPGPDQYFVRARATAMAHAISFAQISRVRAWFAAGPSDFVLLAVYAPPIAAPPARFSADLAELG